MKQQLPNKFIKGGFTFTLECRNEHAAIYRQQWNGKEDASIAYEVVRPQIGRNRFIDGQWQASGPYEIYPSSETWGDAGWTFTNLDDALDKMASLSLPQTRRNRFDEAGGAGAPKKTRGDF
jgi:hypothetical protein